MLGKYLTADQLKANAKTESGLTADAVAMARPALMDRAYELALTTGRVYVVGEDTRKRWEQEAASAAVAEWCQVRDVRALIAYERER